MFDRLWRWFGQERRDVSYSDPALMALYGGGSRTSSGEPVNLDRAAGLTAVWACVTLIAGSIGSMPLILYKRTDDGRDRYIDHPLYDVLHTRPNPVQSVVAFWEAMVTALLLRGNAYAMLTRDADGRVRALWYVNPDRVHVDVTRTGRLRYKVATGGQTQMVPDSGMLHVTGPMSDDGYTGRSVIATFRETLGLGLALERYGGEFFANSARPAGVLKTAERLSSEARSNLKASLEENHAHRGRRHKTLVLEEGLEFQPLAVPHDEAQFIESRRFTTEEICRVFGVPPAMVGAEIKGSMTYSNAETRALDYLKFCLGPHLARIESAINFACISPLERRQTYVAFLPDALLTTDTKGRYEAYEIALRNQILTIDEVRRKENLPKLLEHQPAIA
jgi:HK97 family phage portal protein